MEKMEYIFKKINWKYTYLQSILIGLGVDIEESEKRNGKKWRGGWCDGEET